jgi:hypothetical protein
MLPDPEPMASIWAQPNNPIHPPDMLPGNNVINGCSTAGYPSPPQTGFETTAKPTPEPRLIDNVAALTCARLALCCACEELSSWDSELPPDKLLTVEQWRPSEVVSRTSRM